MEIKQIRYFIAVAQELHFRNAARRLNISQPPLSYQIRKLEDELGVLLLERDTRNVTLTKAGKYFYDRSQRILNKLDKEVAVTQNIHNGQTGSIVLGFSGSAVFSLLPAIIKQSRYIFPDLILDVRQLTTQEQIKELNLGNIDVGILVPPVYDNTINTYTIKREGFNLCVPENHHLASRHCIDIVELSNEKFVMTRREDGEGYYDLIIALCMEGGFTPSIIQTAKEQQTIVSLVAACIGIAIVPESTRNIANTSVVFIPINSKIRKQSSVAWKEKLQNEELSSFIEVIKQLRAPD
ncbi:aromatic hydrocarbon utilization transcriptional regulator CatR (LysR family) [Vibrio variabilis]|uniref:Aromatic hydrocarbon utilization transcriptional regulator CatR (LysR family) n=1 Tax=Vibrio variabilis TaxID=990271 RepID=A0ABQ0JRS7_9VIBR|nr:aromatic hydrocarbon utilization transcriptional regulator CatR (LysR family) [Vibrio variabilis]